MNAKRKTGGRSSKSKPSKPEAKKCWTEGKLTLEDVKCPICFDILMEPVCLPCHHCLCRTCFETHTNETSLCCPLCRLRLSVWSRNARKSGNLVHEEFWARIKDQFTEEVGRRLDGLDNPAFSLPFDDSRDAIFVQKGEIAQEFQKFKEDFERERETERRKEEEASTEFIHKLQEEEQTQEMPVRPLQSPTQIQADFELASRLHDPTPPQSPTQLESDYEFAKRLQEEENRLLQESKRERESIQLRKRNSSSPSPSSSRAGSLQIGSSSTTSSTPRSSRSRKRVTTPSSSKSFSKRVKYLKNQPRIPNFFASRTSSQNRNTTFSANDATNSWLENHIYTVSDDSSNSDWPFKYNDNEVTLLDTVGHSDGDDSTVISTLMEEMLTSIETMSQDFQDTVSTYPGLHLPGPNDDVSEVDATQSDYEMTSGVSSASVNLYDIYLEAELERQKQLMLQEEEDRKFALTLDKMLNRYGDAERDKYELRETRGTNSKYRDYSK